MIKIARTISKESYRNKCNTEKVIYFNGGHTHHSGFGYMIWHNFSSKIIITRPWRNTLDLFVTSDHDIIHDSLIEEYIPLYKEPKMFIRFYITKHRVIISNIIIALLITIVLLLLMLTLNHFF